MKLYLVAPINDEISSKSTSIWAEEILQFALTLGIDTVHSIGLDVSKSSVIPALIEDVGEPGLFCYLDHGHENFLYDSNNTPLIDSDNISLLHNKFIYTVACCTGMGLGKTAVEQGAAGFIGYTDTVVFSDFPNYLNQTGICLISGLVGLLRDGLNANQARTKIEERISRAMTSLWRDHSAPYRLLAANSLRHNRDCLVLHGNENWQWDR